MKRETDNEELIDDVLAEAAPPDFRDALLGETLGLVRRRRRFRHARNVTGILALLGLLGFLVWPKNPKLPALANVSPALKSVPQAPSGNYTLIGTQPLPGHSHVATQPITSAPVATSEPAVPIVQTTTGNYQVIDDKELLALVAGHPAVLIHTSPGSEKLVFANPADQNGFPAN